jgi:hypothetical protein
MLGQEFGGIPLHLVDHLWMALKGLRSKYRRLPLYFRETFSTATCPCFPNPQQSSALALPFHRIKAMIDG